MLQGHPDYGDKSNFSPAIVISNRRTALGDFIRARNYQIGESRPLERAKILREVVFGTNGNIDDTLREIKALGITYLYVGETERQRYGKSVSKFLSYPELFAPVYDKQGVTIFEVRSTESSLQ